MINRSGTWGVARLVVLAAVLALHLPAPADAHVLGTMVVSGSSGGTSISRGDSVSAQGNTDCPFFADGYPQGDARAASTGGSVSIVVSRTMEPGQPDCRQLEPGENLVAFWGGAHFVRDAQGRWVSSFSDYPAFCRLPSEGGPTVIGTMQVDRHGDGSGTYNLPDNLPVNGPDDAGVVCIWNPNTYFQANFAPVIILP